jgi:hypothetical protein
MGSVFGRAVVVAGALMLVLGSAAGAAAKPQPPVLAFSPAPYDYGQVAAGQAVSRTFTLANSGRSATGRLRVTLTGAAAFTIAGDTCRSLGPGKTCTVTVRFAPASAGTVAATLIAAAKKGAVATDALTGTGGVGGPAPSHLYWAADGSIWESNLDGTSPHVIVTGAHDPVGVAVGASHLYWAGTFGTQGVIFQANLDGTSAGPIDLGDYNPGGVAVDTSHVYWSDTGEPPVRQGAIWEANLDGTNPVSIVPGQAVPLGVAVGGGNLYWANSGDGTIWKSNLDGTSSGPIITGQASPGGVAPNAIDLYWATAGDGTIWESNLDGTSALAIVTGQHGPAGVAVSGSNLYWAGNGDGTIWESGLDGSSPVAIVTGQHHPTGVAVGPQ